MRPRDDPEVLDWLSKAAEDLRVAEVLLANAPELDSAICFHCQQAAEKSLKALILASDGMPERTHDLDALVTVLARTFSSLETARADAALLTPYAVIPRYPPWTGGGNEQPGVASREAEEAARRIERIVRGLLGAAGG